MKLPTYSVIGSLSLGLISVGLSNYALAAQAQNKLEIVSVVATRNEMALDDIPESVSIISADTIANAQASNFEEILKDLAGVDTYGGPRANAQQVVIRGISGSRVLYNIDGARQSFEGGHRSRFVIEPELIKQMDVLRGPASAQYGSGAIGGVVAVRTRNAADFFLGDPQDIQFGGLVKSGYEEAGNEQSHHLIGYANAGTFDLVLQAGHRENDDFYDGSGNKVEYTADQIDSNSIKLSWLPGDHSSITLSRTTVIQKNTSPSNPANPASDSNPLLERENDTANTHLGYRLDYSDALLAAFEINLYQNKTDIVEDRVDEPRHDSISFETIGGNIYFNLGLANDDHQLSFGADTYQDTASAKRNGEARPQFPDAKQTIYGVFVQYQRDIFTDVSLIGAVRYDSFNSESNTDVAPEVNKDAVSFRLGGTWDANDWLSLHANYSEAFRAPNLIENYATGIHFLGNEFQANPDLKPESSANKEIGFSLNGSIFSENDSYRIRVNLYQNDIDDFIETQAIAVTNMANVACLVAPTAPPGCVAPGFAPISVEGTTTAINLEAARLRGFEIEASYAIGKWSFDANYGSVRGESRTDGQHLLNIPADAFKLHAAREFEIGEQNLTLGTRLSHYRAQDRTPELDLSGEPALPPTDRYTIASAYMSWQASDNLAVNLGIDNLTDRRYRSHLSQLNSPGRSARLAIKYQL